MSRITSSVQHMLGTAGIGLVLSAGAILPAAAQQAEQSVAQSAEAHTAPAPDSLTVTRDPVTGQLRAATAAEQASMRAAAPATRARIRVAAPRVQQKFHASGAGGARLTDSMLNSAIAVRAPDGTIATGHSVEEATAKAQSRANVAPNPVTE
jgi:hypothetical protein